MQKWEPKTWGEVQRHYAMLQKQSKKSLAAEIVADLKREVLIKELIIIGLMTLIVIQMYQKRRTLWKASE